MLKNHKLSTMIENKKKIVRSVLILHKENKVNGLDVEIDHLKKENLHNDNKINPNQIVSPIHVDKSPKVPKIRDDFVIIAL